MRRPFEAGERVLLFDTKGRRYLVQLAAGGEFHTHAGPVPHDDLIGQEEGWVARSTRGARFIAVRPTLAEVVLKMPRGAQVIYPKDLGPILIMADVFPGARVFESGLGSGALSMALLRAGVRLSSLLPPEARSQVNAELAKNGVPFDISSLMRCGPASPACSIGTAMLPAAVRCDSRVCSGGSSAI